MVTHKQTVPHPNAAAAAAEHAVSPKTAAALTLAGVMIGYAIGVVQITQITPPPSLPPRVAAVEKLDDPLARNHPSATIPPVPGVGPSLGDKDAPIAVVEFTDYECTLCSRYFTQAFPLIRENYIDTGKVRYETRNFPLSLIHPYALIASEAAFCALKEDRFWQMHDKLLGSQAEWTGASDPAATIRGYAKSLGLDMSSFDACLSNHETQSLVEQDLADARGAGINGSPSFWVFGTGGVVRQINGAYPYATFQATFDAMLKP